LSDSYTGVKVLYTEKKNIDYIYRNGFIDLNIFDGRLRLSKHQNMFLVIKDEVPKDQGGAGSVLCWVKDSRAVKLKTSNATAMSAITPRNKEQAFAFEALLNNNISVVSITGKAGSGKTIMALSAALCGVETGEYSRVILVRNMVQVGKNHLGYLPGDLLEKTLPFNQGYLCNIERLLNNGKKSVNDLMDQMPIDFLPLQVIRGASWPNSVIILDEAQSCSTHEILTFGTRIDEGSKVILLGDLQQRDIQISKEATGLYKFINNPITKESNFVAHIELIKSERGKVAELFSKVFES
jgi:PhoH-like ATPase